MSASARRHGSVAAMAADADLAKMGYESNLPRSLSMLSVLGMSFAIMAGMHSCAFKYVIRDSEERLIIGVP